MPFQLFQYPLPADDRNLEDLNRFLAGQRVATVNHHVVNFPRGAMLVFVVETVGTEIGKTQRRGRVDYRDVLDADDFEVFRKIRDVRKRLAQEEGVPIYAVFTNAQLASIAEARCRDTADLLAIEGIGQARVERYGEAILAALAAAEEQQRKES